MGELHVVAARFGRAQFGPGRLQRLVAGQHVVEQRLAGHLDVLRDAGDARLRRRLDRAGLKREVAQNRGKKRRLTAAVGAHEADPLAGRRYQRHLAVQHAHTARQSEIKETQHFDSGVLPRATDVSGTETNETGGSSRTLA